MATEEQNPEEAPQAPADDRELRLPVQFDDDTMTMARVLKRLKATA